MRIAAALLVPVAACTATLPVPREPDPIDAILAEVSAARIRADVDRLASFGTRHTLSATEGPRGIGAARRWLVEELERIAAGSGRTGAEAMTVRLDPHHLPVGPRVPKETELANVEAVLPGARPEVAARRVLFVAHYDSRASDVLNADVDAPGANDDGSGVAAVLEAARVLSRLRFDATIVFLAVAGEEQGLLGSAAYAAAARRAGTEIAAVLSADIVGDPSGPGGASARDAIRVFSEGVPRGASAEDVKRIATLASESDSPSRQLARFVADVAQRRGTRVQPKLVFRADRFLRGGDHFSFNDRGYAAVRFTDVHEKYDRQHQDVRREADRSFGDLPEFVDAAYLADVTRLVAATLAELAEAPGVPRETRILAAELTTDTTLRWSRPADPDLAGFEVLVRRTPSASWEEARDVGDVTEARLPLSKDEFLFAVRAYDRSGRRGLPAFPAAAKQ